MKDSRKTVVYPAYIMKGVNEIQKREGLTSFSQTVIWILKRAIAHLNNDSKF